MDARYQFEYHVRFALKSASSPLLPEETSFVLLNKSFQTLRVESLTVSKSAARFPVDAGSSLVILPCLFDTYERGGDTNIDLVYRRVES